MFVKHTLKKDFVMPLKSNRKLALSLADKRQGRFVPVETLELNPNAVLPVPGTGKNLSGRSRFSIAPAPTSLHKRR